jgi:hypothetical protein
MNYLNVVLFANKNANLKVALTAGYKNTYKDSQGQDRQGDRVRSYNGSLTSAPYSSLAFSYMTDDFKQTSQLTYNFGLFNLHLLRTAFGSVHARLAKYFVKAQDGNYSVSDERALAPVVVKIEGKEDWISLTPILYTFSTAVGPRKLPAVGLSTSKFVDNGKTLSSIMSTDEFNALNDEVQHIDYVSLMNQLTIMQMISTMTGTASAAPTRTTTYNTNRGGTYSGHSNYTNYSAPTEVKSNGPQGYTAEAKPATAPTAPTPTVQNPTPVKATAVPAPVHHVNIDDADAVNDVFNDEDSPIDLSGL